MVDSSRTTNYQLAKLAGEYGIPLIDICAKDQLLRDIPSEGGYIINMQDSTDGNGTHWVALWLERDKSNGRYIHKACYFDSFGISPPIAVVEFCNLFGAKKIVFSTKEIQNINGGHCGQYCIDFLRNMMNKRTQDIEKRYEGFIDFYDGY